MREEALIKVPLHLIVPSNSEGIKDATSGRMWGVFGNAFLHSFYSFSIVLITHLYFSLESISWSRLHLQCLSRPTCMRF